MEVEMGCRNFRLITKRPNTSACVCVLCWDLIKSVYCHAMPSHKAATTYFMKGVVRKNEPSHRLC